MNSHIINTEYCLPTITPTILQKYEKYYKQAKNNSFGIYDSNIVFLDTEATVLNIDTDEIIQIAASKTTDGNNKIFNNYINPKTKIPRDVVKLTKITDEKVKDAPFIDESLDKFKEFIGDTKIVVAHNIDFDKEILVKYSKGKFLEDKIWIDTVDLAKMILPFLKNHKLITIAKAFNLSLPSHDALDDVKSTEEIFKILLAGILDLKHESIELIQNLVNIEWSTSAVFNTVIYKDKRHTFSNNISDLRYTNIPQDISDIRNNLKKIKTPSSSVVFNNQQASGKRQDNTPLDLPKYNQEELNKTIELLFNENGLLKNIYKKYNYRSQQKEMSLLVGETLNNNKIGLIEAGTGVGKSIAYLIPSIILSKKLNKTIGVATKTNLLLDQLVYKELPQLKDGLKSLHSSNKENINNEVMDLIDNDFIYSSLKGRAHYLCLNKIEKYLNSIQSKDSGNMKDSLTNLAIFIAFIEQGNNEDFDNLKMKFSGIGKKHACSRSNECNKTRCPYYKEHCYVVSARKKAIQSDIVITNHSYLLSDALTDGYLLPNINHWVIDEAHSIENEAREQFKTELSTDKIEALLRKLNNDKLFKDIEKLNEQVIFRIKSKIDLHLNNCNEQQENFEKSISLFTKKITDLKQDYKELINYYNGNYTVTCNYSIKEMPEFLEIVSVIHSFNEIFTLLFKCLDDLNQQLKEIDKCKRLQNEIIKIKGEIIEIKEASKIIFLEDNDEFVYSVQFHKNQKSSVLFTALYYDIGVPFRDKLINSNDSMIFTSATLSLDNNFDYFKKIIGIYDEYELDIVTNIFESCYDFNTNMKIFIIDDISPDDINYKDKLQKVIIDTHVKLQGSILTLFTSKSTCKELYKAIEPILDEHGLELYSQTKSKNDSIESFLSDKKASLFGLKAFWEGFDAPGDTLKGIVITRLPFDVPNGPLFTERNKREKFSSFGNYMVPPAIFETKQAIGRLIRNETDHGIVIITDKRLLSKSYGREFIKNFQSQNIQKCSSSEIVNVL